MKSPDKELAMTFRSIPTAKKADGWEVLLVFPPDAGAETRLRLQATDGAGVPVGAGVFEFMGQKVRIDGGRGEMSYPDFIAGIHEKAVWLMRPGMMPVPGGLTFR